MSYTHDKKTQSVIINGFEKGIAPSPHFGIGNLQNINITTEPGEASVNYARTAEDQQPIASGTLTRLDTSHLTYAGTPDLIAGTWITVTASSIGSPLTTGTYYVTQNSSGVVQLSTTNSSSDTLSGMGVGTATFNTTTTAISKLVASATDTQTAAFGISMYFMMDQNGVVLYRNTNNTYWQQLVSSGPSSGNATGLCAFNSYLFRFYTDSGTGLGTIDYTSIRSINSGAATTFTVLGNTLSTFTHQALSGHDNTMYYTDGTYIGSIAPAFSAINGYWTYDGSTSDLVITIRSGVSLAVGMPVTLSSTGSFPSGGQLSPNFTYYITSVTPGSSLGSTGLAQTLTATGTISSGATAATLTANWTKPTQSINVTFSDTEQRNVLFTNGSASITWSGALANNVTARIFVGPTQTFTLSATVGGSDITPTGTFTGILTIASTYFNPGVAASYTWNQNALQLPTYETAQCLAELGTNLMIGAATANLYPWDRSSTTATTSTTSSFFYPVILPEPNTTQLVTVNNILYVFCGYKGNIYVTTGGVVSPALKIPDYVTGQNEPVFTWLSTMYLRGRIWFSAQAANTGGVWSFVPEQTINPFQDVGNALRLENKNSNGTYSGGATVLLPKVTQPANGPQYWSGIWNGSTTYGIDFSSTTPYTGGEAVIETDMIPIGSFFNKVTPTQYEYKLAAPLATGESVQIYWRSDLTSSFTSAGTAKIETSTTDGSGTVISGYFTNNTQNLQWIQLKAVLTSTASNPSYNRITELRIT